MTPQQFLRLSLGTSLSAIALIAGATPALAQSDDVDGGVYVTGRIGVALPSDFNVNGVQDPVVPSPGTAGAAAEVNSELGDDITFSGAVGYRLPTRILGVIQPSFELEYSYTDTDVTGGNFNGGNQTFLGDVEVQTFTINYQGDLVFDKDQAVTPFFGGGLGIADVESDIRYFPAAASAPTFAVSDDDTAFTYHFDAGLRYDLTDSLGIDARVRYQRVDGVDLERRFIANGNNAFNANVSGDYETVNFLAGIRYNF